jgi:hypothetical protein
MKKPSTAQCLTSLNKYWLRGLDLNQRHSGYESETADRLREWSIDHFRRNALSNKGIFATQRSFCR